MNDHQRKQQLTHRADVLEEADDREFQTTQAIRTVLCAKPALCRPRPALPPASNHGYTKRKNTVGFAGFSVIGTEVKLVEFGQVNQLVARPTFNALVCASSRQPK